MRASMIRTKFATAGRGAFVSPNYKHEVISRPSAIFASRRATVYAWQLHRSANTVEVSDLSPQAKCPCSYQRGCRRSCTRLVRHVRNSLGSRSPSSFARRLPSFSATFSMMRMPPR